MAASNFVSNMELNYSKTSVVIMAGGKGKRISSMFGDIPKPLIPICGKPVLQREIECLQSQGFKNFIITVSHMADRIIEFFGDGSNFGVHIDYFVEETPMGNAGALFKIKDKLSEDFLLLNADSMFDIDFSKFIAFHKRKGGLVTLLTHPNSHPYDSGLVFCDENKSVIKWLSKEDTRPIWYKNRVNSGLHVVNKKILDLACELPKVDLDRQLLKPLCGTGKIFAYDSPEYVKDMGTPERFLRVCKDFSNGVIQKRNLLKKQRAIFLDRDGTINRYVGFLTRVDDLELIDGSAEAIKRINDSGYLAIVVTNQPVIARGEVTFEQLDEIHNKLETLLGNHGAFIDGLYFCPHHPNKGFIGERLEFKKECNCRKPKPGLLLEAARDFNIDLSKSWMIGDDDIDVLAGQNAGCRTIKLKKGYNLLNAVDNILGDI